MSSVFSARGRAGTLAACLVLCGLAVFPAAADTVGPIKQFGYSYGRALNSQAALAPDDGEFLVNSGTSVLMVDVETGLLQRVFSQHLLNVTSVAYSLYEPKMATGSEDQTTRGTDLATGAPLFTTAQPTGIVRSVAYSADGTQVLTGGDDNTAWLWNAANGRLIRRFTGHTGSIRSVAFSPDRTQILTGAGAPDNTMRLWNVNTGQLVQTYAGHTGGVRAVAFSRTGAQVLSGSLDGTAIIWDTASASPVWTLTGHTAGVTAAAFSPDGTRVITGSGDTDIILWSAVDGARIRTLSGHAAAVNTVIFTSDGTRVLSAAADNTVKMWDLGTGRQIRGGHPAPVNSVMFSPDGSRVLTGGGDGRAIEWNVETGIQEQELPAPIIGYMGSVYYAGYSPDGAAVLTGMNNGQSVLWDSATGLPIRTFMWHTLPVDVRALAYSPDGTKVLTGGRERTAKLWDVDTGILLQTFTGHLDEVTAVAFSPDGTQVLTGGADMDRRAILWDAATGVQLRALAGHSGSLTSVAFSADGTYAATAATDATARVYDLAGDSPVLVIRGHDQNLAVTSVAFSPDGRMLLTGSEDTTAKVWNLATGGLLRTYAGHAARVSSVAFSPDGALVVTGSTDRTAMLWDAAQLTVVPAVTGLELSAAQQLIEAGKLYASPITRIYSAAVPLDFVISQSPVADTEVLAGSAVALEVSLGAEFRTVPDLVGLSRDAAAEALAGLDLAVGMVTLVYDEAAPENEVMAQNPEAGAEVAPRSAVNLTVSLGPLPAQFTVPNVVGLLQSAADQALRAGYLYSGAVTRVYSATVPVDHVVAQRPAANTLAPTWSEVDLDVSRGPAPVAVPNVVGLNRLPAQVAIVSAGLTLGAVTEVYDEVMPAGQVLSQNPAAGVLLAPGSAVAITVSRGPLPLTVPDVVGQTQADAQAALTGAGLNVGPVTLEYSLTAPAGQVLAQNPAAGAQVAPGTVVSLTVSRGAQPVTVPNIVGQTQPSANAAVIAAGLGVGSVTEQFSATVVAGRVISQSPPPGRQVPPGTPVSMVVSKGPQTIFTPNVVGRTLANAEAEIVRAGLTVGGVSHNFSATVPEGNVISQNPAAGAAVAPGTGVDLVISRGVRPLTVPNVVGRSQASAERAVADAGLVVGLVTEQFHNTAPKGQVIAQSPAAGTEVSLGAAVNLVVSKGRAPAGFLTVPNVVGGTQAAAQTALTGAGLGVGAVTFASSATVPAGRVMEQNPVDGVQVAPGTPVDLVVSSGPGGTAAPTLDEARRILLERFYDADLNGDAQLSFAEAQAVLPGLTRGVFDALDTNSNGFLTRAELAGDEDGCLGCRGCVRNLTRERLKSRLGDLFLAGLAIGVMAALGRARRG